MQNIITITGRLCQDITLKEFKNADGSVGHGTSFSLAVARDFKDRKTGEVVTDFIDCAAWRHDAEYLGKYAKKGNLISVQGRLQIENWEDKDGNARRNARVQVSQAYILTPKPTEAEESAEAPAESVPAPTATPATAPAPTAPAPVQEAPAMAPPMEPSAPSADLPF